MVKAGMSKFSSGFYGFALRFVQAVTLVLTGVLAVCGLVWTCYAEDMTSQEVLTRLDNPLVTIAGLALAGGIVYVVWRVSAQEPSRIRMRLSIVVYCWIVLLGILLILFGKTVPAADAMSVYSAAESLAAGDTSVIHPTESYLSYYPQQVGLMAFFEVLIRFWNLFSTGQHAYHFIKCLYVVLTCGIVFYQEKTVRVLWRDERAGCLYLVIAGLNLPFIMYSSFVYGEIPSFAALSMGLYHLCRMLRGEGTADCKAARGFPNGTSHPSTRQSLLPHIILSLLGFTLAVMLRKNNLIIIIAVVLVVLFEALRQRRGKLLLYAVLCVILSAGILPCVTKYYELRSGSTLSSGVPAMAYFAMGMQEASRGPGWYNGYNFDTYQAAGLDTETAVEVSREAIAERLAYFSAHPSEAASFYARKFLTQWADGTYASRQATLATFGGRSDFFTSLYEGEYSGYFIEYGSWYQNLLYIGAFLYCLWGVIAGHRQRRAGKPDAAATAELPADNVTPVSPILADYLGLIGVLGGFLFHMIWEANSRYIFLYSLLLMPYAARGISETIAVLRTKVKV